MRKGTTRLAFGFAWVTRAACASLLLPAPAFAQTAPPGGNTAPAQASPADGSTPDYDEVWSIHGQTTFTDQYHPAFTSPYRGANSLDPGSRADETFDATFFLGARLWDGGEAYFNPEIDQGFGLSDTYGIAAFPSGEAYKFGDTKPYFKIQRGFVRQTFDLGGDTQNIDPDANQLGTTRTANNLIVTVGKISVVDIFDTNSYAHDPRADFLNWAVVDSGAYDYAADSWAYTYGTAVEWTQDRWTLRGGIFDLSKVPNEAHLETNFRQFEVVSELEERHTLFGRDGKLKLLAFDNRGRMGDYNESIALAELTHTTPSTVLVRRYNSKPGAALNFEQAATDDLGIFARASMNDGSKEAYEFTDMDRSATAGISLKGKTWSRPDDTIGASFEVGSVSRSAQDYFALGGLGILVGDGQLPHYGHENDFESYYSARLFHWFTTTFDYQFVDNPGYNRDRGPVSVLAVRLHAEF
jgi:high affinity Mn2+ porin